MTLRFRVFLASPGDVPMERAAFDRAVAAVDEIACQFAPCTLEAVRWETAATPSAGRPQGVINEQLSDYDMFVGVMWRRFGTPSGEADTGTEEEYRRAYARWQREPGLPLLFYFCEAPFYPRSLDELDQMRRVIEFRQQVDRQALSWPYTRHEEFEGLLRKHLAARLKKLIEARQAAAEARPLPRATPDPAVIAELRALWPRMSPDLQRAFSIAYNDNRAAGDPGVQTRDLFAALQRVGAPAVRQMVAEIPEAALPGPTPGPVVEQPFVVSEQPWLSGCIASSVRRLGRALPAGRELTGADVFADIARNGSGSSVQLLRQHRIGPAQIDDILARHHLDVLPT